MPAAVGMRSVGKAFSVREGGAPLAISSTLLSEVARAGHGFLLLFTNKDCATKARSQPLLTARPVHEKRALLPPNSCGPFARSFSPSVPSTCVPLAPYTRLVRHRNARLRNYLRRRKLQCTKVRPLSKASFVFKCWHVINKTQKQ